jgi:tetratricopeptide (TPR) repeat protein
MASITEQLASASQLQAHGRREEAEALYSDILREAPEHAETLNALGLLLHQAGRHSEAIEFLLRSLAAHGPHPLIHTNLGAVYLAAGLHDESATHCREAVRLCPDLPAAHHNLGATLLRRDRLEEAERAFRRTVQLMPTHLSARCQLGIVLHKLGKQSEALTILRETVERAPSHAQAHHDLGAVLLALGRNQEACRHLHEAIRLKPDFIEAHDNLGLSLRQLDRMEEARQCFREALRHGPSYVKAHLNLGNAWEADGKFDEALAEFREACRLDPQNSIAIAALSKLATIGRFHFTEHEVEAIARRAAQDDIPLGDRHQLHFALAAIFDQRGDYRNAFEHYHASNEIRKELERSRGIVFDPDAMDQFVDRLIAVFTPAHFERVRDFGLDTELPIFVVGMMRSGTTLTEQILASHPRVHGAGELQELDRLIATLPQRLNVTESYPEVMRRLDTRVARDVANAYEHCLRARSNTAERVVDKLPGNFLNLGLIATLYPRARIIHCRRDPVDTCLSAYFQNFSGNVPQARDLRHLGRYYRAYQRLMAHWTRALPVPIFELQYEELTAEQEAVSRRLVAFCGLEWDERCLRFHETERVVRTASVLQVRQPMYRSAVGRWKRYEAFLGPLLETLSGSEDGGRTDDASAKR